MSRELVVSPQQIWKHKYSGERVVIVSHITQGIWNCQSGDKKDNMPIADIELLENWKLLKNEGKRK